MISLSLLISAPTYSWFRRSQEMARFEKVSSPNTLYIDTTYAPVGGLGLINYAGDTGNYKNLYLTGNVKTDLVNPADGKFLTSKSAYELNDTKYLNAGMLIGTDNGKADVTATVENVAIDNIDVFGLNNTGGLIGYKNLGILSYSINTATAADDEYNSKLIKIHGRGSVGGMIGKIQQGYAKVDMAGIESNHTFNLTEVACDSTVARGGDYFNFGVGGFIGSIRAGYETYTALDVEANYFKNIIIGSEKKEQTVSCKDSDIFTGGVIGVMNKCSGITIENCEFSNLSVESKLAAAGLVAFPTTATKTQVKNTHLKNTLKSKRLTITRSTDFAGGLIGSSDPREGVAHGSNEFTFDNCSVSGYTISGKLGAGGVIGFRGAAGSLPLYIKNIEVSDCTIKSDGYSGGLIGEMNNIVLGYNILAKNIDFDSHSALAEGDTPTYTAGYICGSVTNSNEPVSSYITTRNNTTPTIKLVGFSRQMDDTSTMLEKLTGSCNYGNGDFGTGGYVVFADYTDNATNNPNDKLTSIYAGVENAPEEVIDKLADGSEETVTDS